MEKYLENLNWRYATKRYDESKKLSEENLENLKEALRLSASSYGLQPYKILVIEDEEIRKKLRKEAWDQPQITEASQLLIFAAYTEFNQEHLDKFISNTAKTRRMEEKELEGYKNMIENTTLQLPKEQQQIWAAKQAYIALGNLLSAAATFRIDASPMEGFSAEGFDKILNLKEKGLTTAVIAAVGYRSMEDDYQHLAKVRKSKEELFTTI
ncbi:NAD(P)H-dependent oxidoreductase [Mesonia maritima]|uniref:Nitroreductase n=1 Tax=Mesonia maritima TaxID=1793873 RepID=A0ABU1K6J7_9FLAO|nr:NAD(P)H-dependent oxidoreductase [Mesonia maritima]MDR6301229.1 nitroreductase [Mesonia maritima]